MSHLQKFQAALASLELDGALISSEINQRYLCDFPFSDGYLLITPERAYLLTDSRYIEAAKESVRGFEILLPKNTMTDTLAELISEEKISRLVLEEESVSYSEYQRLSEKFSEAKLLSGASKLLGELRAIKTPEELDRIARAQEITDRAFSHILDVISNNLNTATEQDVALELEFFMRKQGSDGLAFETIAVSGSASSRPHGVPSNVGLRKGFLTMDFGAKYDGYCSDMTRTVYIGTPSDEEIKVYNTVLSAQNAAFPVIHAGVAGKDVDKAARDVIENAGYKGAFGHSLGHSLGMEVHERPNFSPSEQGVIPYGAVLSVEPGIYLEGKYGVRIEDIVYVTDNGHENLTNSSKELFVI